MQKKMQKISFIVLLLFFGTALFFQGDYFTFPVSGAQTADGAAHAPANTEDEPSTQASADTQKEASTQTVMDDTQEKTTQVKKSILSAKVRGLKKFTYTGKELTPVPTVTLDGKELTPDTDFTLTYRSNKSVGTAKIKIKGVGTYTGVLKKTFAIIPPKTSVTAIVKGSSKLAVSWKKIKRQTSGYKIQCASDPEFSHIIKKYVIKDNQINGKIIQKLESEKKYYIRVRTYKITSDTTYNSRWSHVKKIKTAAYSGVDAPALKYVDWVSDNMLSLRWTKVQNAKGYALYRSRSPYGDYRVLDTYAGTDALRAVIKVSRDKVYHYQVRAYTYADGKKIIGDFSDPVENVTYKESHLGYLFPSGVPSSESAMRKFLVTVKLPVRRSDGTKGYIRLPIHHKLVDKVKACFQEMYALGFKVRATDTGSFNWRKMRTYPIMSHHSYGCVVDLNWNANPMVTLAQIGKSAYRPGRDPYSITKDVVAIWKKYGFSWGGDWTEKKDYMHLTYTNN